MAWPVSQVTPLTTADGQGVLALGVGKLQHHLENVLQIYILFTICYYVIPTHVLLYQNNKL